MDCELVCVCVCAEVNTKGGELDTSFIYTALQEQKHQQQIPHDAAACFSLFSPAQYTDINVVSKHNLHDSA